MRAYRVIFIGGPLHGVRQVVPDFQVPHGYTTLEWMDDITTYKSRHGGGDMPLEEANIRKHYYRPVSGFDHEPVVMLHEDLELHGKASIHPSDEVGSTQAPAVER